MVLCITLPLFKLLCALSPDWIQTVTGSDHRKKVKEWEGTKANKECTNEWVTIVSTWDSITLVSL